MTGRLRHSTAPCPEVPGGARQQGRPADQRYAQIAYTEMPTVLYLV
ncbi:MULTISPECIES: hypothetical protein [Streptomyces]|nr:MULTISPECIES: hypothetical protein [Streptomyces]MBK3526286.1 hypothetical protein [Streptomyces sp. MBT70]